MVARAFKPCWRMIRAMALRLLGQGDLVLEALDPEAGLAAQLDDLACCTADV